MGGTVLFLFCVLAVTHAGLESNFDNGCPRDTRIKRLLPHLICEQYYECSRGTLITRLCPLGLLFNPDLGKCDWLGSGNAKCKNKRDEEYNYTEYPEDLDSSNPNHAESICKKNDSKDVLIAHENCNEFYICSYRKPILLKCARNLLFNVENKKCDWPHNVECGDRVIPVDEINYGIIKRGNQMLPAFDEIDYTNSDPNQAVSICATPGSDGELVAHEYCNMFYKCFRGKAIEMKCPLKLYYNSYKLYCDWHHNVDCIDRIVIDKDTATTTNSDDKSNESEEIEIDNYESDNDDPSQAPFICAAKGSDGKLVVHEMCNQYYKCTGGRPVALHCSGNFLFNRIKNYCDWPVYVDCEDRYVMDKNDIDDFETTTPVSKLGVNNEPNEAPAICRAEGSDGVLVAHENCNQFYKCYNGHPVELTCPGTLLYNPIKEYCDWPNNVSCGERAILEVERKSNVNGSGNIGDRNSDSIKVEVEGSLNISDPSQAREICAAEKSNGVLIAHENCNQFYKCFEGQPVALFCPINLVFNPLKGFCDWPRNVDCGNREIPKNQSTEDSYATRSCSNKPNGKVISHENCNMFYKCVDGQAYLMHCPPGLFFDTFHKVCNWPVNVDCGERLTETQMLLKEQAKG